MSWSSRPVFLSSNFKDMHAERDWLRSRVFPRIDEELRKRRHHLEPIDLRLGVETAQAGTEEARELLVLKVCLDEIKRSRPFLLVFLGDRYGWVPPGERIAAAAREQGFETSLAGKSVTALEIEFGILKDNPDQKARSLFFFRKPLAYDRMPEAVRPIYSDAHSPDPEVRAGTAKLEALKAKLRADPELAGHIFEYETGWRPGDRPEGELTGLDAFGELVFDKLWAAIDDETKAFAALPPPTWEEQERAAIAEFVEHRSRGFVGRQDILATLRGLARSPAGDGAQGPPGTTPWGACVLGSPGSGKSALFAVLHRDLAEDPSLLLLANVAGGTTRGSSVDAMLRRWILELAASMSSMDSNGISFSLAGRSPALVRSPHAPEQGFVDVTGCADGSLLKCPYSGKLFRLRQSLDAPASPFQENASNDDIENAFYVLLHRVATHRRVVVLLDALDQFEPTPRGKHLTWFKQNRWHPNARIVATAIPCPASDELSQWAGIEEIELPPLTAADAAAIGKHVWGRYHRELNPQVLAELTAKTLPDGAFACGNPLWLTLALEQLNLLDADDFARAEREFSGSPTERMLALLLDTARRMPPAIENLYGWLLEQTEETFGTAETRAFATAIALSRNGWRDQDLQNLIPRLAPLLDPEFTVNSSEFNILALANLRRAFRAHVVRRGENDLLDFFHAQTRRAVLYRCAASVPSRLPLHAAISDHLESLEGNDPLRCRETTFHLLHAEDNSRLFSHIAHLHECSLYEEDSIISHAAQEIYSFVSKTVDAASSESIVARLLNTLDWRDENLARICIFYASHVCPLFISSNSPPVNGAGVSLLSDLSNLLEQRLRQDEQHEANVLNNRKSLLANKSQSLLDNPDLGLLYLARADCLDGLSRFHSQQGNPNLAIEYSNNAMRTRKGARDASNPVNPLTFGLKKQGDIYFSAGRFNEARLAFEESLSLIETWATPVFSGLYYHQQDCKRCLADSLCSLGSVSAAEAIYRVVIQNCLSMRHKRTNQVCSVSLPLTSQSAIDWEMLIAQMDRQTPAVHGDPQTYDWLWLAASARYGLTRALMAKGDAQTCLKESEMLVSEYTQLKSECPSRFENKPYIAFARLQMADAFAKIGDIDTCVKGYFAAIRELESLLKLNLDAERDVSWTLSNAYNRLGDLLFKWGDHERAEKCYQALHALALHNSTKEPSNPNYKRQLWLSYARQGMLVETADPIASQEMYEQAFLLLSELAEAGMASQEDVATGQQLKERARLR